MLTRKFTIINEHGLHARPASLFCDTASQYSADIKVFLGNKEADGKSVISILLLEVQPGSNIQVEIDGTDEEASMQALTELITSNFYEY